MDSITITTEAKMATNIREFIDPMAMRKRIGMVYFQRLSDGGYIHRTVSEQTDRDQLSAMIKEQKIYIPIQPITSEKS
jgi:hypothetical protein